MDEAQQVPCTDPRCVDGQTIERQYLERLVDLILLAGNDGQRKNGTGRHPYFDTLEDLVGIKGCPDRSMADLTAGLAGRPPSVFGHDSIDRLHATKKVIAAAGLPEDWGTCKTCNGFAVLVIHPQ